MDAKFLIIISLGSLILIIGAVAALWLRSRPGSSSPSATMPSAPAPIQRRDEAVNKPEKEAQEPPRGHTAKPPAEPPPPTLGYGSVPPPPPSISQPTVAPSPIPAPGAIPPPAPQPAQPTMQPKPRPQMNEVNEDGGSEQEQPTNKPVKPGEVAPSSGAYEFIDSTVPPPAPITQPPPVPEAPENKPKQEETGEGEETEVSLPADWLAADDESAPLLDAIPALPYLEGGFDEDDFDVEPIPQNLGKEVLFSTYYPKEIAPEKWQPLHAYIFRTLATAAVEADAGKQLGSRMAEFRGVRVPAKTDVPEGALVTAAPQMEGFQFNPPSVTIGFYKDWHRFDFEVRAKDAPINQSTNGLLTFSVEGIIIADVPLSIFLGETTQPAGEQANTVAKAYEAVFCSYSHKDQHIVARAERAYKALGLDYLRDVVSLKSGQDWSDELLTLINRADIFQLFWSDASAQSEHVRFEWEHALQVAGWRANFIRPVYWEDPKPHIPDELKHIHFAYQPDLDT